MEAIIIPIMIFSIPLLAIWTAHRRRMAQMQVNQGVDQEIVARIDKLQERVAVLEKIITDNNYNLRREFEELEDD